MESQKIIGIVLLLTGITFFIVALSADFIGLGKNLPLTREYWYPGFGYKQIGGFIVGTIFIIAGFYLQQLASLLLKITTLEDKIDENRYLLEQLPQLQKKIDELESQISQ